MGTGEGLYRVGSASASAARWSRRPMGRCSNDLGWCALDTAYRCAVERSSSPLRGLSDLPSPFSAMAADRRAGRHLVGAVRGPEGAREIGSKPEPGRRLVQRGKKGGDRVGPTRCGKGSKIMAIADGSGVPIAVGVTSASPNESTLVESTLDRRHIGPFPERMIGDKAYDSDPLDERMRQRGIEMIAPNRQKRRKTQDGRPLRRYRHRWKIERVFAWLKNFRRICCRWERHADNFLGMVQLGCMLILLRHL
jgi:transposase